MNMVLVVVVPLRYNSEMGYRAIPPVARLVAGAIAYVLIVIVAIWMLGREAWSLFVIAGFALFAVAGPIFGAALIWLIVRRTNRKHEQRSESRNDSSR